MARSAASSAPGPGGRGTAEATARGPVVGLTGGIASGKSTVGAHLAELGAMVVDADQLAREVTAPGSRGLELVTREFGRGVLDGSGSLDRRRLGSLVFSDPRRRERLEEILHPLIAELSRTRLEEATRTAPLAVYQAPLIFETGRQGELAGTILVHCRPRLQMERLRRRDRLSEEEARSRLAAQMAEAERLALATWVVDNSGTRADTRARVLRLWEGQLRELRRG